MAVPIQLCTRRRFLVSTSIMAAAGALSAARFGVADAKVPLLLVSAERALPTTSSANALVLAGPRVDRLQVMANYLSNLSGRIMLRLDPVDDQLLDVAAQQANVSITRGVAAPNGFGIFANLVPQARSFA